MLKENLENNIVNLTFDIQNIYSHSLVIISASADKPFKIELDDTIKIVGVKNGTKLGKFLKSEIDNNKHSVVIEIGGLVDENKLANVDLLSDRGTVKTYGMQYYPFISSYINKSLKFYDAVISSLKIELPNNYRAIWFKTNIQSIYGPFQIFNSVSSDKCTYYFIPGYDLSLQKNADFVSISIYFRLGANEYARILTYPFFYWLIILLTLCILALDNKPNATFAALAAYLTIMIRNYRLADTPQQNTILRDIYIFFVSTAFVWAIIWEVFEYYAIITATIIPTIFYFFYRLQANFLRRGILPPIFERLIYKLRVKNEIKSINYTTKKNNK